MALLYMDGFAHNNVNRYMATVPGQVTPLTTTPRVAGCYYIQGPNTGGTGTIRRSFTAASEVFTGIGFKIGALTANRPIVAMFGDAGATQHVTVNVNALGFLELRRGTASGTLLATGTTPLSGSVWYYIEMRSTIADSGGITQVRLNGLTTNEIDYTGDTKNAGTNTTIDAIGLTANATVADSMADWYILNTSGSLNNTWLGDVAVRTLVPNGNGNASQLTNSSGNSTNNYTYVDEIPPSSTDYTGSATTGQADTYAMSDLPGGISTVYGLQFNATMAKSDATLGQSKIRVRSGGTNYTGTTYALSTTYQEYSELREVDPATSAQWTPSNVNGVEGGMEVA